MKGRLQVGAVIAVAVAAAVIAGAAMLSPVARSTAVSERAGGPQREADELVARFRATGDESLRAPLIRAQIAAGRHSAALALAERADPSREMLLLQGEALLQLARGAEASALAARVLDEIPDDGAAALLAGRAAFAAGDLEAASSMALAALRGSGVSPAAAWMFRARIALFENDPQAAAGALARAREAGAAELDILPLDVERLLRAGDLDGAQAALGGRNAEPRGGPDPRILAATALIALAVDDAASAARAFEKLETISRADPLMRLWHAYARERAGDAARAAQLFALAHSEFPLNPMIAVSYGQHLIGGGNVQEANALAERFGSESIVAGRLGLQAALAASDTDAIVTMASDKACDRSLAGVGDALLGASGRLLDPREGERERVCGLWRGLVAPNGVAEFSFDDPTPAEGVLLGRIALGQGDDFAAAAEFAAARAGDPASVTALAGEIRTLIRSGDEQTAQGRAAAYVAAWPESLTARVHLAALAEALGQRNDAIAALSPVEQEVLTIKGLNAFYIAALQTAGEAGSLARVAGILQRERPGDLLTIKAHRAAGRLDLAAGSARLALVSDPSDQEAAAAYQEIMDIRGRGDVAREFLASIGVQAKLPPREPGVVGAMPANAPIAKDLFEKARYDYLMDPTNGLSALTYAKALERAGMRDEAARVAREAAVWAAFSTAADAS